MKSEIANHCKTESFGSLMDLLFDSKEEDKSQISFYFNDTRKDEPIYFDKILPRFDEKEDGSSFIDGEKQYNFCFNYADSPRHFGGFQSKNLMLNLL
jgi:hypothetical protein